MISSASLVTFSELPAWLRLFNRSLCVFLSFSLPFTVGSSLILRLFLSLFLVCFGLLVSSVCLFSLTLSVLCLYLRLVRLSLSSSPSICPSFSSSRVLATSPVFHHLLRSRATLCSSLMPLFTRLLLRFFSSLSLPSPSFSLPPFSLPPSSSSSSSSLCRTAANGAVGGSSSKAARPLSRTSDAEAAASGLQSGAGVTRPRGPLADAIAHKVRVKTSE